MKACIIAGCVLLFIALTVTVNAVYVHKSAASLTKRLEALPDIPDPHTTPAQIVALRQDFEDKMPGLGLSVSYAVLDRVVEALYLLESRAKTEDIREYQAGLALLADLLSDIHRLEKVTFENVLGGIRVFCALPVREN